MKAKNENSFLKEILSITPDATPNEVNKAYKRHLLNWHPDKWNNCTDEQKKLINDQFIKIKNITEQLTLPRTQRTHTPISTAKPNETWGILKNLSATLGFSLFEIVFNYIISMMTSSSSSSTSELELLEVMLGEHFSELKIFMGKKEFSDASKKLNDAIMNINLLNINLIVASPDEFIEFVTTKLIKLILSELDYFIDGSITDKGKEKLNLPEKIKSLSGKISHLVRSTLNTQKVDKKPINPLAYEIIKDLYPLVISHIKENLDYESYRSSKTEQKQEEVAQKPILFDTKDYAKLSFFSTYEKVESVDGLVIKTRSTISTKTDEMPKIHYKNDILTQKQLDEVLKNKQKPTIIHSLSEHAESLIWTLYGELLTYKYTKTETKTLSEDICSLEKRLAEYMYVIFGELRDIDGNAHSIIDLTNFKKLADISFLSQLGNDVYINAKNSQLSVVEYIKQLDAFKLTFCKKLQESYQILADLQVINGKNHSACITYNLICSLSDQIDRVFNSLNKVFYDIVSNPMNLNYKIFSPKVNNYLQSNDKNKLYTHVNGAGDYNQEAQWSIIRTGNDSETFYIQNSKTKTYLSLRYYRPISNGCCILFNDNGVFSPIKHSEFIAECENNTTSRKTLDNYWGYANLQTSPDKYSTWQLILPSSGKNKNAVLLKPVEAVIKVDSIIFERDRYFATKKLTYDQRIDVPQFYASNKDVTMNSSFFLRVDKSKCPFASNPQTYTSYDDTWELQEVSP